MHYLNLCHVPMKNRTEALENVVDVLWIKVVEFAADYTQHSNKSACINLCKGMAEPNKYFAKILNPNNLSCTDPNSLQLVEDNNAVEMVFNDTPHCVGFGEYWHWQKCTEFGYFKVSKAKGTRIRPWADR